MTVKHSDPISSSVFTLDMQGWGTIVYWLVYKPDRLGFKSQLKKTASSINTFRLALIPTQAFSRGTRVLSWWQSGQRVLTTHLHLTLRFTLGGAISLLPLPSWHVWINFTFTLEMQVKNSFLCNSYDIYFSHSADLNY